MSMNNNNNSTTIVSDCDVPVWFWSVQSYVAYLGYSIGLCIHMAIVTVPFCITAVAFCRRYAKELLYGIQRVAIVTMAVENLLIDVATWTMRRWAGVNYEGVDWYMSNYSLMWFAGHLIAQLVNMFDMMNLLLFITMAVDRLLAVSIPLTYRTINHKLYLRIGASVSVVLGVGASLYDIPRYNIVLREDNLYHMETNLDYTALPVVTFLSNFRNFLNIAGLCAIVCLNVATVLLLTKARKARINEISDTKRFKGTRKVEHDLLIMTVSQGCVMALEKPVLVATYIFFYTDPTFIRCGNRLMGPVLEFYMMICAAVHLLVLFTTTKVFSKLLYDIPFLKRFITDKSSSKTQPVTKKT